MHFDLPVVILRGDGGNTPKSIILDTVSGGVRRVCPALL